MAHPHVCMMEGPDPELSVLTAQFNNLQDQEPRVNNEVLRLQSLLRQHNIVYEESSSLNQPQGVNRETKVDNSKKLPKLPQEIMIQILGHAVTTTATLTDPFHKGRKSNMTSEEQAARKEINVNFLATNKDLRDEGRALILKNNKIVFTQAAALVNFAKIPVPLRQKFEHVTLRVVGRYYGDNYIEEIHLPMDTNYHDDVPELRIPVLARPKGMMKDHGVLAYCYTQLADFLTALKVPRSSSTRKQTNLLPSLKTMRIDLVNFVDHFSFGRMAIGPVIRWHLGRAVDELMVTTSPRDALDFDMQSDFYVLRNLVKKGGLFSVGNAAFVSSEGGLKALSAYEIEHRLVLGSEVPEKVYGQPHPEGGIPPASHPLRDTVFKWTFDDSSLTEKKWVEFDRLTNEQLEDDWDVLSDEDYDEEGEEEDENESVASGSNGSADTSGTNNDDEHGDNLYPENHSDLGHSGDSIDLSSFMAEDELD